MPIYEYRCLDCAHQYEKREGFDAPALQKCPKCGASARRVLHAAPVVFKGSGFYSTDNRPSAPESETEAKTETEVKAEPSKPAKAGKSDDGAAGKDVEPAAAG